MREASIERRRASLLALVALFLATSLGCAPSRTMTIPNTAVLEVANRAPAPQDIFIDGQRIGRVGPGERVRFHALPIAAVRLLAQPPDGGVTAAAMARLSADEPFVWTLVSEGDPLPLPPGLGALGLVNGLGRDVEVTVDDRRIATLFADERRVIPDIPAGAHVVEVLSPTDGRRVRRTLDVIPDAITPWSIRAAMGTLEVLNEWKEPALILVSGLEVGVVQPGQSLIVPNRFEGPLSVEARGARTGAAAREELAITEDATTAWHLAESGGGVIVINKADESLAVAVDSVGKGLVAPLDQLIVDGLAPGEHVIEVGGADSGVRLFRQVRLSSGERAVWSVDPRYGAVRVVNSSPEAQYIYLDGSRRQQVAPGEAVMMDDVPIGPRTVSVVGVTSGIRQDRAVHARAEAGETWRVRGVTGSVVVDNRRDEALRVYVDAEFRGIAAPAQVLTIEDVSVGRRLVEVVGQSSDRVFRERMDVLSGVSGVWTVRDPTALLIIENRSGESLKTGGTLAVQAPVIVPGEPVTFRLPPGKRRVALVGVDSEFVYALETTLVDGETVPWSVAPAKGAVVVYNRSGEPLRLTLDGAPLGTVNSDDDLVLATVKAGRHVVQGEGTVSGAALRWPFVLMPDARARWEVGPQFAQVRVDNRTDEALEIAVDGQVWGRVEPGGPLSLTRLASGSRALEGRGVRTGIRYATVIDADVSRVAVWQVLPAEGTLVVTSARDEALEVSIDGALAGTTTGPGDPVTTRAAAGTRIIDARPAGSGGAGYHKGLRVAPDRTTELHVPPKTVRLDVINDTAWSVRTFVGDRFLGEVPTGKTLRIDDLTPGERITLRAVTTDGERQWRHSVVIHASEDRGPSRTPDEVWRLLPPPVTRPPTRPEGAVSPAGAGHGSGDG